MLVVGSPNSANSNRLREVAQNMGVEAYMSDSAGQIAPEWLNGKKKIGVTAGASAPEVLVREVIQRISEINPATLEEVVGTEENTVFPLPKNLLRPESDSHI